MGFKFRNPFGVVQDTDSTYTLRDAYGNLVLSSSPFYVRDAFGNVVLSNTSFMVRDAYGGLVTSTLPVNLRNAYGQVEPYSFNPNTGGTLAVGFMGQSELHYILSSDPFYIGNGVAYPTSTELNALGGNVIMHTQENDLGTIVSTTINATSVANGLVNPAMAAMACWLKYVRPNHTFHVADFARSGTGRNDLSDESTNATTEASNPRYWSDFTGVLDRCVSQSGRPLDLLIECWYRADIAAIPDFKNRFWPFYFGSNADGTSFTPGVNANTGRRVDNFLWDGQATASSVGRATFSRSGTQWAVLTPMSDIASYPVDPSPENTNFESGSFGAPVRDTMINLTSDALAQSVGLVVGPSAHIMRFNNPGTAGGPTHPSLTNPDGQVGFMWPFAIAIARKAGLTINEPVYDSVQADPNGAWVDVYFTLPNGGTLTTKRILESRAAISNTVPHRQEVIGFEIGRAGVFRPVFNTASTSYDNNYRGTVVIADTGSGSPRKGRIRITPNVPFAFGDSIRYLAGGASAVLLTPRDIGVDADMLLETIPSMRDVTATYPFPGVAVRPKQESVNVPVTPPAFTAKGVYFDGADYFINTSQTIVGTNSFCASAWIKLDDTAWNATTRRLWQFRVGSTVTAEAQTASSGRLTIRLTNNTASPTVSVYAGAGTTAFVPGQWYHILVSTYGSVLRVYVNGVERGNLSFTSLTQNASNLTQHAIAAQSTATNAWKGDIGHLWISFNQDIDFSVQANREKFALAGVPVNLGSNGQTPTGTAPHFYFDGVGPAWTNLGTFGSLTATGTVAASSTSPSY